MRWFRLEASASQILIVGLVRFIVITGDKLPGWAVLRAAAFVRCDASNLVQTIACRHASLGFEPSRGHGSRSGRVREVDDLIVLREPRE